jgi:hypothetical protein
MPEPGITTSVWGVKPVLVMRIVVTPVAGVSVGVIFAGAIVATAVTFASGVVTFVFGTVTFARTVPVVTGTVVSIAVTAGVATDVTSVTGAVVSVVVCAEGDAVCVHPVTATSATRRIINPMSSFIWCTHEMSIIK